MTENVEKILIGMIKTNAQIAAVNQSEAAAIIDKAKAPHLIIKEKNLNELNSINMPIQIQQ